MDAQALYALRDVAGVPTHPVVFLILGVVTWALHIAAVQVMLGASTMTLWGGIKQQSKQTSFGAVNVAYFQVYVVVGGIVRNCAAAICAGNL